MQSSAVDRPAAAIVCLLLAACSPGEAAAPPVPRYAATAQGRLDAASDSRWLSAEIDARIVAVPVAEGQRVEAGQILMKLACADLAAASAAADALADAAAAEQRLVAAGQRVEARDEADARVAIADAELADARDQLDRTRALVANGWVSQRRIEQLEAAMAAAGGRRAVAAAAWATIRNGARSDERKASTARALAASATARQTAAEADRCVVRAPLAGTILRILKHEGEYSGTGSNSPVMVVADLSRLVAVAEVLDRDAVRVIRGMTATIWLDEQPGCWKGHVIESSGLVGRRTARSLDPSDRFDRDIREVRVLLDGPTPPALVGLRVNVGFVTPGTAT